MKFSFALSALVVLLAGHAMAAPAPMPDLAPAVDMAPEARDVDFLEARDDPEDDEPLSPELSALVDRLDSIPADVLDQGDDATASWLAANLWVPHSAGEERALSVVDGNGSLEARAGGFNLPKCLLAVTVALASHAVPVVKAARLTRLFLKFGNIKKTLSRLKAVRSLKDVRKAGGKDLETVVKILLGVDVIADKCFPGHFFSDWL